MTFKAFATIHVNVDPQTVLEFVLDIDRYRLADHKIAHVSTVVGPNEAGTGSIRVYVPHALYVA